MAVSGNVLRALQRDLDLVRKARADLIVIETAQNGTAQSSGLIPK